MVMTTCTRASKPSSWRKAPHLMTGRKLLLFPTLSCTRFLLPVAARSNSADYHGRNSNDPIGENAVPMHKAFRDGVWKIFWRMLDKWKRRQWMLHVVLGPVFDDASPFGLMDVPEEKRSGHH
ncbi:hypothetical protein RvY_16658-3 [Ramazzottius varieornatus]|uniref:Uncharacterized protein n=1 Tax=Ramazzottius varieornatus TaxID=947166 RepID=A0A1D1VZA2_RAMVA|nr:hypothetical protein RvY_16658-3 [Ramazzottius varieornatus]